MDSTIPSDEIRFFGRGIEGSDADVFFWNDRVFRAVKPRHACRFLEMFSCGLVEELVRENLLPESRLTDFVLEGYGCVIEHKRIAPVLHPQEWSFSMLREAARTVLKVNGVANKYGFMLGDCHGFNILFDGSRALFVDLGSFLKRVGSRSFAIAMIDEFIRCYYSVLQLWSTGKFYLAHRILSDSYWRRYLPRDDYYLEGNEFLLADEITAADIEPRLDRFERKEITSVWKGYQSEYYCPEGVLRISSRFRRVAELVEQYKIHSLLDIGGNEGAFSKILVDRGEIERVVCADYDENAIDSLFRSIQGSVYERKITPALLNVLAPIDCYGEATAYERLQCEAVCMLALTHHLLLNQNCPIDTILDRVIQLTTRYIFIEFMPLAHIDFRTRTKRTSVASWYTTSWFRTNLQRYSTILHEELLEPNRYIFVAQRNDEKKLPVARSANIGKAFPSQRPSYAMQLFQIPVLFLVEGNLAHATLVMKSISKLRPRTLSISIVRRQPDGENDQDVTDWLENLDQIIDWIPADMRHVGRYDTIEAAISGFFKHVEEGIVLDSLTLPDDSFFRFCQEMLENYRNNRRILHINGTNFQLGIKRGDASYYFSRFAYGWGWATWRRSWQLVEAYRKLPRNDASVHLTNSERMQEYWHSTFQKHEDWSSDSWLTSLTSAVAQEHALVITPNVNLVSRGAVDRDSSDDSVGSLPVFHLWPLESLRFPLKHPTKIEANVEADEWNEVDPFNQYLPTVQLHLNETRLDVAIACETSTVAMKAGEEIALKVSVVNNGDTPIASLSPCPVHLSYHIQNDDGTIYQFDGLRTPLCSSELCNMGGFRAPRFIYVLPGEARDIQARIKAPNKRGKYTLQLSLVQESCFWFEQVSPRFPLSLPMLVS